MFNNGLKMVDIELPYRTPVVKVELFSAIRTLVVIFSNFED